jgi:hypothetical protein
MHPQRKLHRESYGLTPEQMFRRFDKNRNGELDRAELELMVRRFGVLTDREVGAVVGCIDPQGDGMVDVAELMAFLGEEVPEKRRGGWSPLVVDEAACRARVVEQARVRDVDMKEKVRPFSRPLSRPLSGPSHSRNTHSP